MASSTTYIVKDGESLSVIGNKLGIKWQEIAAKNQIAAPYTIHAGDELQLPRKAQAANSSSLSTSSTPSPSPSMTLEPVVSWSMPFLSLLGSSIDNPKKATADDYLKALGKAQGGFYPIGANGQWHGGIHFDKGTGSVLDQSQGVKCIADGEIIAWRLDSQYPKATFAKGDALYSTGFVLIRHRLQVPQASGDHNKPEQQDFYSLYMHLADWKSYQTNVHRAKPTFWGGHYKVDSGCTDNQKKYPDNHFIPSANAVGINLRSRADKHTFTGFAERGVVFKIGNAPVMEHYYPVETIISGAEKVHSNNQNLNDAMIHRKDLTAQNSEPKPLNQVVVPPSPIPVKAGELLGYLGQYQHYSDAGNLGDYPQLHLEVFSDDKFASFVANCRAYDQSLEDDQKQWLHVKSGTVLITPTTPDVSLQLAQALGENSKAVWRQVRRLTPVAHVNHSLLGSFQGAKNNSYASNTETLAEISAQSHIAQTSFASSDPIWDGHYYSLTGAKNTALARYTTTGNDNSLFPKRGVSMPYGDTLWVKSSDLDEHEKIDAAAPVSAWSQFPLDVHQTDGKEITRQQTLSIHDLKIFAREVGENETNSAQWWKINATSKDGQVSGWVCSKDHAGVTLQSQWGWPGFEIIDATDVSPAQYYARQTAAGGNVTDDEKPSFENNGKPADHGTLFKRLYECIDSNGDHSIAPTELTAAMQNPAVSEPLSHLIVKHATEWGDSTQWDEMDDMIPPESQSDWQQEKKRIQSLQWWEDAGITEHFRSKIKINYIKATALVSLFENKNKCDCGCNLGKIFLTTRYGTQYGPVYWGSTSLSKFSDWKSMISSGSISQDQMDVLIAMSENEGNLDAVQSYDSEVITAGAMQKTINSQGAGELPIQVYKFSLDHKSLYNDLFTCCGWEVRDINGLKKMYYNGKTGDELKNIIRSEFDKNKFTKKVKSTSAPLSALVNALSNKHFQRRQVLDFVARLNEALSTKLVDYGNKKISDFISSRLGMATVLDQSVNRPAYVQSDFSSSLNEFFNKHPTLSKDPGNWGPGKASYETEILSIYGPNRRMTNASGRFNSLKEKL